MEGLLLIVDVALMVWAVYWVARSEKRPEPRRRRR